MALPLDGLRVVEMGQLLAVPHLTRLMARMGAEVIKIESTTRLDPHRGDAFYGNALGQQPWNRAANFNDQNRNKLGITLDLSKAEGRDALLELIGVSDVFAVNFRPRVLRNLGIEYPTLRASKPDIIMLASTGYGAGGPWENYGAVGPTTEAASGLASLTGYANGENGEPVLPELPHADYTAAEHGLAALMAALLHRQSTGKGQYLDLSQTEAQTGTIGEAILDYEFNGRVAAPAGNSDPTMAPHGAFPCRGRDRWIAISAASDEEWRSLCGVMGNPPWALEARFNAAQSRLAHVEELNASLSEWTRGEDAEALMHRLQEAGVAAGMAATGRDLLFDPHLRARGFFDIVSHDPETGLPPLPYPGAPWRFSQTPGAAPSPAPTLGRDNHRVLGGILGWPEQRIAALQQSGVIGNEPQQAPSEPPLPLDRLLQLGTIGNFDVDFESQVRNFFGLAPGENASPLP